MLRRIKVFCSDLPYLYICALTPTLTFRLPETSQRMSHLWLSIKEKPGLKAGYQTPSLVRLIFFAVWFFTCRHPGVGLPAAKSLEIHTLLQHCSCGPFFCDLIRSVVQSNELLRMLSYCSVLPPAGHSHALFRLRLLLKLRICNSLPKKTRYFWLKMSKKCHYSIL